jgi:hypothetical protein
VLASVAAGVALVCLVSGTVARGSSRQPLTIDELLFRANEYVVAYQRRFSGLSADEHYVQDVVGKKTQHRDMRSRVLFVRVAFGEWVGFRDPYELDGKRLRDPQDRLPGLYRESPVRARKLSADAARYGIGPIPHGLALPMTALIMLDPVQQPRFNFEKAGETVINGTPVWEVRYSEHLGPTLVQEGSRDVFASGSLWIDAVEGRVVRTRLSAGDLNSRIRLHITVTYQSDPRLGAWMPAEVLEQYEDLHKPDEGVLRCRTEFSGFESVDLSRAPTRPNRHP